MNFDLLTSCGKMCWDCSLPTTEETSSECSWRWTNSGILEHGELALLNSSESPSNGDGYLACSLGDVLEQSPGPRYSLSPKAAAGILRRAAKRGRVLPEQLRLALEAVARMITQDKPITSSLVHSEQQAMAEGTGSEQMKSEPDISSTAGEQPVESEALPPRSPRKRAHGKTSTQRTLF